MAEYKPKLKDVALAAQTAGRQAEHAIDGVRELREEVAKCKKDITQLRHEMFIDKEFERMIVGNNLNTIKLDNSIHIELATFAKNKCPHCGSHNLHFTFDPDAFSDSTVNCRDCHNSWKVGGCAEDIDSPYVKLDIFRNENRMLFDENKRLQEENEKLKKQAAIDASYMVTVEDLMARLKSREERIEALKQENNKLESENEQLKNYNKNLNEYVDKFFKDMNPNELRACDIMRYELNETEKENKKLLINNTVLESDNDFLRHEIDEYKDKINVLKDEKRNLQKEKEELKKALNIYQDITDLDVTLTRNTAYVRLIDSDDAGRTMVKGSDLDMLCDAYLKYHDAFRKEKKDEENK